MCGTEIPAADTGLSFRPPWMNEPLDCCRTDYENMKRGAMAAVMGLTDSGVAPSTIMKGYAAVKSGASIVRGLSELVKGLKA